MRSLILRIFVCYWIAAGIVIVVSAIGPHEQMHRPEATAALTSSLHMAGRTLIASYEAGGCATTHAPVSLRGDQVYIATPQGKILCDTPPPADYANLAKRAGHAKSPVADTYRDFQLVAISDTGSHGTPYVVLLRSGNTVPFDAFGLAIGPTTIWISVGVTILLGVLMALPIGRVRKAARAVANGRLDTRVHLGWLYELGPRFGKRDVLAGLADDFNHMAGRLESLADSQRTLFRDISHELRSPLARLSVALELAREAGPATMHAPLDRIEQESARVNDLIGQMLTLSHMETMQELNQPVALSLRDLIECLLPDLEYEAAGRRRTLRTSEIQDCTVSGDPAMLQRAVENVVRNAIRYTPEQGVIEIVLRRIQRDGADFGILVIEDDGPGVPHDELQAILRPFYRADKSRQLATGGFGVGLAIANRAVNLHAGQISIANRPEGGLAVEMSFPLIGAAA
jgi:two-component system sensor histidine kinase CpxA